ncbi:transcriptional regulator [Candidatus Woesearchaeota archaeon]|nr:MAG: transcriptional regulator [Candidatus Woesearchaeota archaeon]
MEHETLYTASKWNVLEALGNGKMSPQELAQVCKTSVANISQQLRLLELAGIVKTERISNRDKGQPRLLYSLVSERAYIIATGKGFVSKKTVHLSPFRKALLRIWFLDDGKNALLEKVFLDLEKHLSKIDAVYYDQSALSSLSILIVTQHDLKNQIKNYTLDKMPITFTIKTQVDKKLYKIYEC